MADALPVIGTPPDAVYVAAPGYAEDLEAEIVARGQRLLARHADLFFVQGASGPAAWAQNTWLRPETVPVASIGEAARALRARQRNWHLHALVQHRRAQLVVDKLPPIRFRPLSFPADAPSAPLGAWTLLDREHLLLSAECSSPFPDGQVPFVEDRVQPPNRAYLKLWEALTLARSRPEPGTRCLDLGAAPGGWSWVCACLGAEVVSIDRAALAPQVLATGRVAHQCGDAFRLRAEQVGEVQWILSDLAAYPERLLELARYWAEALPAANMIFTIKLQGPPDPAAYRAFLDIPGSRVMHLSHNKHELTWFRLMDGGPIEAARR
ncbi:SAM-dependent methyltransferase [Algiphilus sp.]|uniref:SAM-dependent methyltransferase n=1 Tax=Algiphilus sp. TaxID=1872431 RepID=UPI003B530149